ncbi:MAG: IS982 family transposase, partial [Pseudonocardiaceae bacterium]|nr:IS982 family transposase [Pseudonocardiaceae bacterium]
MRNHHLIRSGQVLLADKGFSGQAFKHTTEAMGLTLLRPDRQDET